MREYQLTEDEREIVQYALEIFSSLGDNELTPATTPWVNASVFYQLRREDVEKLLAKFAPKGAL